MADLNPTVPQQEAEAEVWVRTEYIVPRIEARRDFIFSALDMQHAYLAGKAAGLAQAKAMVDAAREEL